MTATVSEQRPAAISGEAELRWLQELVGVLREDLAQLNATLNREGPTLVRT